MQAPAVSESGAPLRDRRNRVTWRAVDGAHRGRRLLSHAARGEGLTAKQTAGTQSSPPFSQPTPPRWGLGVHAARRQQAGARARGPLCATWSPSAEHVAMDAGAWRHLVRLPRTPSRLLGAGTGCLCPGPRLDPTLLRMPARPGGGDGRCHGGGPPLARLGTARQVWVDSCGAFCTCPAQGTAEGAAESRAPLLARARKRCCGHLAPSDPSFVHFFFSFQFRLDLSERASTAFLVARCKSRLFHRFASTVFGQGVALLQALALRGVWWSSREPRPIPPTPRAPLPAEETIAVPKPPPSPALPPRRPRSAVLCSTFALALHASPPVLSTVHSTGSLLGRRTAVWSWP